MKKFAVVSLALAAALSAPAQASVADLGTINTVYGTSVGAVLFSTTGTRTAPPSCQWAARPARFAIDASTPAGQSAVAILLNAQARGKRVTVIGTDTCTIWGDTETVHHFLVED